MCLVSSQGIATTPAQLWRMSGAPWVKAEILVAEPMAIPITRPMVKTMGVSILAVYIRLRC